jgi:hypothetical protein
MVEHKLVIVHRSNKVIADVLTKRRAGRLSFGVDPAPGDMQDGVIVRCRHGVAVAELNVLRFNQIVFA